MRLLIADDDSSLRTALRLVFEEAGHEVLEAASATDARALTRSRTPDLIIIDAGLADGGVNLWRELQMDASHEGRALLLTGNVLALGALQGHPSVFGKPFDYDVLLTRIEAVGPRPGDELRSAGGR